MCKVYLQVIIGFSLTLNYLISEIFFSFEILQKSDNFIEKNIAIYENFEFFEFSPK